MFTQSEEALKNMGAHITTLEIKQQPELWQEVWQAFFKNKDKYKEFLQNIYQQHDFTQLIFTGAGTSAYVGQSVVDYLNKESDQKKVDFKAVATTDLVSNPELYFQSDIPTVLVSFARSGNSPESLAAVKAAKTLVKDLYQVTITCAKEGKLALATVEDSKNILVLQPQRSNDQGFAMTGSFTCMFLSALLFFDPSPLNLKEEWLEKLIQATEEVIERESEIDELADLDFNRIVYLGSGELYALTREAQLKILELTAGEVATLYETPLGFRHGPKSFIDSKTLVLTFIGNNSYTSQYDTDLVNEVYHDQIALKVLSLSSKKLEHDADQFVLKEDLIDLPTVYLTLPFVVYSQALALMKAVKLGNKPDTPSPSGTVNRVVQGVIIYDYDEKIK